jgi:hypothetical protein
MPSHSVSDRESGGSGSDDRLPVLRSKAPKLPVSEFLYDRSGAASPFGEQHLPLPVSELTYVHPTEDAFPQHL